MADDVITPEPMPPASGPGTLAMLHHPGTYFILGAVAAVALLYCAKKGYV